MHVDTPNVVQSYSDWVKENALVTHKVIDATYPPPSRLGTAMKSVVPKEGVMRVDEVINAVCAEGPCQKCQSMILVTGRVCHGTYGGTLIDITPVFGKSRFDKTKSSLVCTSFCHSKKEQPLKIEAAARRKLRRKPQTGGNETILDIPTHISMHVQM